MRLQLALNVRDLDEAVEFYSKLFDVEVKAVRTVNYLGKKRRVGRIVGRRPDFKKAYVTLADPTATIDLLEKV